VIANRSTRRQQSDRERAQSPQDSALHHQLRQLASSTSASLPRLVIGASEDFIVDRAGVEETARFLGVVGDTTTISVSSSSSSDATTTSSSDTSATR
jgi:alpha-beta hydrolase superfamily lysophospholipase